jgi:hypothetical protein
LRNLGYCIIVEGYTVPAGDGHERYCNSPLQYVYEPNSVPEAYVRQEDVPSGYAVPADNTGPGIMYRPRQPYTFAIYHKKDPKGSGHWLLQYAQVESLENLSPVLALQIQRTAFGGRRANFIFDQGTLTAACLSKTSEINGFVDIPVEVMKAVVQIPGSLFTIRLTQITDQQKLVAAQQNLFEIQSQIAKGITPTTATSPTYPGVPSVLKATDLLPTGLPSEGGLDPNFAPGFDTTDTGGLFPTGTQLCGPQQEGQAK